MKNIHQEITDKIIAEMQKGNMPWVKPWSGKGGNNMPRNAVSKRAYSGANVILLWLTPYEQQEWLTYKQAQELGGNVKKGEKGTHICYAATYQAKDKETGEEKTFPVLKSYTVFNIAQCENINIKDKQVSVNPDKRDADCQDFLASTQAIIRHGESRAYYSSSKDFIMLPDFDTFNCSNNYYAVALHELVHWSGHEQRCNRIFGKRFGDKAYAAEELVAEIGAAFMCAEFGFDAMTQHVAYVQSWIEMLKDDPKAFITAASKASAAVEYLRGLALQDEKIAA